MNAVVIYCALTHVFQGCNIKSSVQKEGATVGKVSSCIFLCVDTVCVELVFKSCTKGRL